MSLRDSLKKVDSTSSVSKEFRVYTIQGAVLSVITVILILYLVVSELVFNFQVTLRETVHVNETNPRGLEVEFDISLHSVSCAELKIDAHDPSGQQQSLHLDKNHHVWKHRFIMENGKRKTLLGKKEKIELGSTLLSTSQINQRELVTGEEEENEEDEEDEKQEDTKCGSCYGAGEDEDECCDTCDDVKRAYSRKGWHLADLSLIKQCQGEAAGTSEGPEKQEGEACNVHGVVALDSGGGNLHLAPGEDMVKEAKTVNLLDLLMGTLHEWNVTHTIHKLRFGPEYPNAVYQLDGQSRSVTDTHGMYQYYFQIIPTTYHFLNGTKLLTNQYSVTEHLRHVNPGSNRGFPGIFFIYEVSPLHVDIREEYQKGWIAFFTSVCAIVGGVVTVMGMVDQFLFSKKSNARELAL